jgi:hypothetical protein
LIAATQALAAKRMLMGSIYKPSPGVTYKVAVLEATIADTYKAATLEHCLGEVIITVELL